MKIITIGAIMFFTGTLLSCGGGGGSGSSDNNQNTTGYARQVPVATQQLTLASANSGFNFISNAFATNNITLPDITVSRSNSGGGPQDSGGCNRLDFVSNIVIKPLEENNKKLLKDKIYHIFVRTNVIGSGTGSDVGSGYGSSFRAGIKYGNDLVIDAGSDGYKGWISKFKSGSSCDNTNFATSDDWTFDLDGGCADAEIISQNTRGNAFIKINDASANTATQCTLTVTGKAMNASEYRNSGVLSENEVLTQTAKFNTISDTTSGIPAVDKLSISDIELPSGESIVIDSSKLTTYAASDTSPNRFPVPSFCGTGGAPECAIISAKGNNISSGHWFPSSGSTGSGALSFYWTVEKTNITMLTTFQNSANVLVQKKLFFYVE